MRKYTCHNNKKISMKFDSDNTLYSKVPSIVSSNINIYQCCIIITSTEGPTNFNINCAHSSFHSTSPVKDDTQALAALLSEKAGRDLKK